MRVSHCVTGKDDSKNLKIVRRRPTRGPASAMVCVMLGAMDDSRSWSVKFSVVASAIMVAAINVRKIKDSCMCTIVDEGRTFEKINDIDCTLKKSTLKKSRG